MRESGWSGDVQRGRTEQPDRRILYFLHETTRMKGIFQNVFVWGWFFKLLDRTSTSSLVEGNLEHEEEDKMQDIVLKRKRINLFIAIMKN